MARVIKGTIQNSGNVGSHLFKPVSQRKLNEAQEDAANKGFRNIYIHDSSSLPAIKKMRADSKAKKTKRPLSVFDKHQLTIARKTLKMPDAIANVLGPPTKADAKAFIARLKREGKI